jgi:hypothetical protein
VVEDLEGGGDAVGSVAMFELGVELLVDCVTKVGSDSLEETLANVPACLLVFPLFSLAFACMGGSGVVNGAVVAVRFGLFNACGDAGLMVVLVDAQYLGKESVSVAGCCVAAPVIGDVLNFDGNCHSFLL